VAHAAIAIATVLCSLHLFEYDLALLALPFSVVGGLVGGIVGGLGRRGALRGLLGVTFVGAPVSRALFPIARVQLDVLVMFALLVALGAAAGEERQGSTRK
jgi:hypothetical protein